MHLSERRGEFFNDPFVALRGRLAPARAHSSHYLKNRTKLTAIRDWEAKKPQFGRKCCAGSVNGKNCAVAAERPERHTAGAVRLAGRRPRSVADRPEHAAASGAYATASTRRATNFLRGKLT
ncbi:hypothetical protein [Burkholderia metallica]|uniref:hypothetical protein n=1 Tax=Burkholderia metallica TaxID=488729 RepID=UPI00157AAEBE|nr:hypothetical protein [Burkholderia metallica]